MKYLLKFPRHLYNYIRISIFDYTRYLRQAVLLNDTNALEGKIIKKTHSLEKRLSFQNPDPSYGKSKVIQLIELLIKYDRNELKNRRIMAWSLSVIRQMVDNYFTADEVSTYNNKYISLISSTNIGNKNCKGGYFIVDKKSITMTPYSSFKELAYSRHSIRSYKGAVPDEIVENAVEVALKSPSNCNLQPIKIYQINDRPILEYILKLQRGNKGFTSNIHQLIVFVANLSCYSGFRERNQCYVDTGIFSVSFAYALHDLGYGSCMLNWASTIDEDKSINKILDIPKNHIVTLTMAIGDMSDTLSIPNSLRRIPKEIITVI